MTFTTDRSHHVLSYGFNGMSWDADRGWCQYSYFVPDGVRRETETKILIVLGDDIGDYVLQGYADGGCDQEIDGVSCTVTCRETTLADVLDLLCRAYQAEFEQFSLGRGQESPFRYLSQAQYQGLVWQLLEQYGLFSGTPRTGTADGRLDESPDGSPVPGAGAVPVLPRHRPGRRQCYCGGFFLEGTQL
mgnify:CR=1 FL=1